jgi:predicted phage terminase large subunit-like protein
MIKYDDLNLTYYPPEDNFDYLTDKLQEPKKTVVKLLLDGHTFWSACQKTGIKKHIIYKMKEELKDDFKWVYKDAVKNNYIDKVKNKIDIYKNSLIQETKKMRFSRFVNFYINDYNPEAEFNKWNLIPLQDRYFDIWDKHPKSCIKAPREHLKTTSVCEYLVKRIFERDYPLDIVYLHGSANIAVEKLRDIQMMIERNPIFRETMDVQKAKNWKDGELRLADGTSIYANAYGCSLVGRHPDIIVLDDIIDQSVIFSDTRNEKAKRKFYSDIYPMITNATTENGKKLITIGTAQREDDIYNSLPNDVYCETMRAVIDEEKQQVLEPALFSWETLMKVKSDMSEKFGEKFWLKEYMNAPFTAMGDIIKPDWIKTYQVLPSNLKYFQGWDLSVGKDINEGDYTAGVTIGVSRENGKLLIYVLDVFKERIDFAKRLKIIQEYADKWSPTLIGIEENVFQYDTVQTLKKQTNLPIKGIKTIKNKVEKFQVDLAPHFENGKIFIKSDLIDLRNELLSLPYGKHDDQADALSHAIAISSRDGVEPIIDFF